MKFEKYTQLISAASAVISVGVAIYAFSVDRNSVESGSVKWLVLAAVGASFVAILIKTLYSRNEQKIKEHYFQEHVKHHSMVYENRPKVFLSYDHSDRERAMEIYRDLGNSGFRVWVDELDIAPGDNILENIGHAIKNSDYVVPLITNSSVKKNHLTSAEMKIALELLGQNKGTSSLTPKIVPVLLDKGNIPLALKNYNYIDARGPEGVKGISRELVSAFKSSSLTPNEAMNPTPDK